MCLLISVGSLAPACFSQRACWNMRSRRHVAAVSLSPEPFFNGENSSSRRTSQTANVLIKEKQNLRKIKSIRLLRKRKNVEHEFF